MNIIRRVGWGVVRWHYKPLKRSVGGPRSADFLSREGMLSGICSRTRCGLCSWTRSGICSGICIGLKISSCKTRSGGGSGGGINDRQVERWRMKRRERAERTEPATIRRLRRADKGLCDPTEESAKVRRDFNYGKDATRRRLTRRGPCEYR
jgi:hypothetical protein